MKYTPPNTVTSPQEFVRNVQVIYDGGEDSVSIATLDWDGERRIAMRWNVAKREWNEPEKKSGKKMCVGMPLSRGYPVWFLLPEEITDKDSDIRKVINNLM